jgi:hypothetical protein
MTAMTNRTRTFLIGALGGAVAFVTVIVYLIL